MLRERLEERLEGLDRRELAGLAVIAVLVVAGAGFWYLRSLPSRVEIGSTGVGAPVRASPEPTPSPALLLVHVAGWVSRPGVYELREGQRIIDAIEAAGGAKEGADLTTINLAALLFGRRGLRARQRQHRHPRSAGDAARYRRGPGSAHRRLSRGERSVRLGRGPVRRLGDRRRDAGRARAPHHRVSRTWGPGSCRSPPRPCGWAS
jgi:hypothetical protein